MTPRTAVSRQVSHLRISDSRLKTYAKASTGLVMEVQVTLNVK